MATGDITQREGASAALTITLASLAESATRVAGRESTAVASAEPAVDYLVGGKITTGTSPTSGEQIDVWVYGAVNDTPTYPDTITGSDAGVTLSSANIRNSALRLAATVIVDSTNDETYWVAPFSVASLFGGILPTHWGLFVTQSTDANLNATAGNHAFSATPIYSNVAQS